MTVLVTGAGGFVGRHAVRALAESGHWVRALVRSPQGADALADLDCELVRGDVTHTASIAYAVEGCEAVVDCVGLLDGNAQMFEQVVVGGTRTLTSAAREAGVVRFVQLSALGVGPDAPAVPYFTSKAAAETLVRGSGLGFAVLRPSFVFGPDGGALPRFLRIARLAPVTPLVGRADQRLQPLWIDDLAHAVVLAVEAHDDLVVELGGPDVVDWRTLWERLKSMQGTSRPSLRVPGWLARGPAALPGMPLSGDQLRMLEGPDNVVTDGGVGMQRLGLGELVPLDEQLLRALEADEPSHSS
jgi:NADH dehydrogenase